MEIPALPGFLQELASAVWFVALGLLGFGARQLWSMNTRLEVLADRMAGVSRIESRLDRNEAEGRGRLDALEAGFDARVRLADERLRSVEGQVARHAERLEALDRRIPSRSA